MSQNTHCSPRIYLKDKEIGFTSFNVNFPGGSQINSCNIKLSHLPDWSRLFNEEIKIYLNENDGVPIFRGFVKQVVPTERDITITANDPRYLLTGEDGVSININNEDNYDGYTASQFLIDYIEKYINVGKTYVGTDYISDTTISTLMKDIRGRQPDIYGMLNEIFNKIDDTDVDNLSSYVIGIVDDGLKAQLIIEKEKLLSSSPSLILSHIDGIQNITYNRRMAPSYGIHYTNDGRSGVYQHGNMPYGRINETGEKSFDTPAEATYASMISILKQQNDKQEINIDITRGFNIGVGSIVRINVDDFDIRGNHRITTKTLSYSKNSIKCNIGLNRKPVTLKKYI
jgi:ribosomal protein L23